MATTEDRNHPGLSQVDSRGMQRAYLVLSDDERALGFVRPVRVAYVHLTCGAETHMSRRIAESYARDPRFYAATYCTRCMGHYPVGKDGEFVWIEDGRRTELKVGT